MAKRRGGGAAGIAHTHSTRRRTTTSTKSANLFAVDDPDAADRIVTKIVEGIRVLVPAPNPGFRRPDLTSRQLPFKLMRA